LKILVNRRITPNLNLYLNLFLEKTKMGFWEELGEQRWDDHRYYHHNRINQSLHLFSAGCFLASYALLFVSPTAAALVGWLLAMVSRQIGHFFFEPKDYDYANQTTHEHKEEIKVGYNLHRKVILLSIWAVSPLILYVEPNLLGLWAPWPSGRYNWFCNLESRQDWYGSPRF
jgi:hypothetical protein